MHYCCAFFSSLALRIILPADSSSSFVLSLSQLRPSLARSSLTHMRNSETTSTAPGSTRPCSLRAPGIHKRRPHTKKLQKKTKIKVKKHTDSKVHSVIRSVQAQPCFHNPVDTILRKPNRETRRLGGNPRRPVSVVTPEVTISSFPNLSSCSRRDVYQYSVVRVSSFIIPGPYGYQKKKLKN